ncbi:hypothetical protein Pfo_002172 [Paulownia fortunei]|nr:hypothetical protein Pfo_002172 [Paulownia fortunei]
MEYIELMMLHQDSTEGRWRGRYERLNSSDEKAIRTRRLWIKKVHGRVKGLKLSRSSKLNWKPFSMMFILSRKIAKIYAGFVKRMKMDEACPAIIFSSQWGLPVLSHSL